MRLKILQRSWAAPPHSEPEGDETGRGAFTLDENGDMSNEVGRVKSDSVGFLILV
jgi:hypothetical protein